MTIRETLAEGKKQLKSPSHLSFIDTPDLDAGLLLAEVLHKNRTELIAHGNEAIATQDREKFFRLITRRREGECVAYILGRKEFRGLEFTVNPNVLVPRPDTETLVDAALEYIDAFPAHDRLTLLDLCTGSGAIAISLKNERPFLEVTASDISPDALTTARLNAEKLMDYRSSTSGPNKITFIQSDLFSDIPGSFAIIVSNPPYVPSREIETLAPEVRREPHLALDGGEDGLEHIEKIITYAVEHLLSGGVMLLEAASEQMADIRVLLKTNGFREVRIYRDLAGRERVISGKAYR